MIQRKTYHKEVGLEANYDYLPENGASIRRGRARVDKAALENVFQPTRIAGKIWPSQIR